MPHPSNALALKPSTERIAALDIIRGLALFGVLQVNLVSFSGQCYASWSGGTYPGGPLSDILSLIRDVLINGKAMSCFSILFGVGLAIQMERVHAQLDLAKFLFFFDQLNVQFLMFGLFDGDLAELAFGFIL